MKTMKEMIGRLAAGSLRWAALAIAIGLAGSAWAGLPTITVSGNDVTISFDSGKYGNLATNNGGTDTITIPAATDLDSGTVLLIKSISLGSRNGGLASPASITVAGVNSDPAVVTEDVYGTNRDKYTYNFSSPCLVKVGTASSVSYKNAAGQQVNVGLASADISEAPDSYVFGLNSYSYNQTHAWGILSEIVAEKVTGYVGSTSSNGQSDWGFQTGSGSGKVYLSGYGNYMKTDDQPGYANDKEIVLVNGAYNYAFNVVNGNSFDGLSSARKNRFSVWNKISGDGTLTTSSSGPTPALKIYDSSEFTGTINTCAGIKMFVIFCGAAETFQPDELYNKLYPANGDYKGSIYVTSARAAANSNVVTVPVGKTWTATTLLNEGETVIDGTFEGAVVNSGTLTINGAVTGNITNTGTIKYADTSITSLTLSNDVLSNNEGTIDLSALTALESVTFNVTTARSVGTIVWPTDFSGTVSVIICDDSETTGTIAFDTTSLPANTTYRFQHADGVEIKPTTLSVSVTTRTYTYTPTTGKACWIDYEFEGTDTSLESAGTDTTELHPDTGFTAATSVNGNGQLKAMTHPWRDMTGANVYPDTWSAIIRCNVPAADNGPVIMFGSRTSGTTKGLIGLVTVPGDADELTNEKTYNKVALATWKDGTKGYYTTNSLMTVANATTAQHVYAFTKSVDDGTTIINVYCDGELITKYTTTDAVAFGTGIQFGGSHGGENEWGTQEHITGFERFDDNGASTIDFVRLYKKDLSLAANSAILTQTVAEYPYISSVGLYERNLDGTAVDWKLSNAWIKSGDSLTAETPPANAMVKLTASVNTEVTLKNDTAYAYERLTFDGVGAITLKQGAYTASEAEHATRKISAASVVVNTDTTVEYGAVDFSGSRISVQSGKTLTFDLSSGYDFTSINRTTTFQLTGYVAAYEPGAVAITGAPNEFYTLSVAYNSSKSYYEATITPATATLTHAGASQNYDSVSGALADAAAGDTITVNITETADMLTIDKAVTLELDANVTVNTLNVSANLTVTGAGTLSASAVAVSGDATITGYDLANATVTVTSGSLIAVPAVSYMLGTDTQLDAGYTSNDGSVKFIKPVSSVTTSGVTKYYSDIVAAFAPFVNGAATDATTTLAILDGTVLDVNTVSQLASQGYYYNEEAGTVAKAVATIGASVYGTLAAAVADATESEAETVAISLKRASSENVTLDAKTTVTEVSEGLYTGTLSGVGTLVLAGTRESALTFNNWTGTVVLPAVTASTYLSNNGFNFNFYGITDSTVRLSEGLSGQWLTSDVVNPAVEIPADKTFTLGSFSPSFDNTFAVLKGEGAFVITAEANGGNDLANVANWGDNQNYSAYFRLGDVSAFTGSLTTTSDVGIALGASKPGKNTAGGKIYVYTTVTIAAGKTWTAPDGFVLADAAATLTNTDGELATAPTTTVADCYVAAAGTTPEVYSVAAKKTVTLMTGEHITSVTGVADGQKFVPGDTFIVTAYPETYYTANVTVTGATDEGGQYRVTGDVTIEVTATRNQVYLTIPTAEHATAAVTVDGVALVESGDIDEGAEVVVTWTADQYYSVDPASQTIEPFTSASTFTTPTVARIEVTVTVPYQVTGATLTGAAVGATPYGPSGLDPSGLVFYTIPAGSTLTLTWSATEGYFFDGPTTTTVNVGENDVEVAGSGLAAPSKIVAVLHNEGETPYASVTDGLLGLYYVLNAEGAYLEVTDSTAETPNEYGGNGIGYDAENRVYAKAVATVGAAGYLTVQAAIDDAANEASVVLKANSVEALTLANGKTVTIIDTVAANTYTYTAPVPVTEGAYTIDTTEVANGATYAARDWYSWTVTVVAENATVTGITSPVSEANPTINFTVTPDTYYSVATVTVDEDAVDADGEGKYSYTFDGPATITVATALDEVTFTLPTVTGAKVTAVSGGTWDAVKGTVTAIVGHTVTLTWDADGAYVVSGTKSQTISVTGGMTEAPAPAAEVVTPTAAVAQDSEGTYYSNEMQGIGWLLSNINNEGAYVQILGDATGSNIYGGFGVAYDASTKQYVKSVAIIVVQGDQTPGYRTVQAALDVATDGQTVKLQANCAEELVLTNGAEARTVTIDANGSGQVVYTYTAPEAEDDTYTVVAGETENNATPYTARDWYTWTLSLGTYPNATVDGLPAQVSEGAANKTVSFTVTADATYKVTAVKVDGAPLVGNNGTYTYTVSGDATVTVETELDVATVTFYNEDGTATLQSGDVTIGLVPTAPEAPEKATTAQYTYTFAGWATEQGGAALETLPAVTASGATYYAVYTATVNSYAVTFINEGVTVQSGDVAYGETPAYAGVAPTKASTAEYSYTFAGWTPAIVSVTGDAIYTAIYTPVKRSYTVAFVNEGVTVQSGDVEYGATPAYAGETPTKESTDEYSYTFAGWTPAIASVTGAATYTATYTPVKRSYTVTFTWHDGSAESSVEYGAMPTAPADPAKYVENNTIYTFAGWEPAVDSVTGAATYTAQYDSAAAVAKIGETADDYYATLAEALAAAEAGDTVTLLADIDVTSAMYSGDTRFNLWINKSLTIDGDGHTLTVKGRGIGVQGTSSNIDVVFKEMTVQNVGNANGRCIDSRGKLNSLTLDGVTLTTATSSYTGYLQPLTIGGNQSTAATVTIKDSVIETVAAANKGYAITTFNPVTMTVTNSTIRGWACLNIKGPDSSAGSSGSTIVVTGSTLVSANGTPGDTNSFSLIKIEDDNVSVSVTESTINVNGGANTQSIVSFQKLNETNSANCTVALGAGNTVTLEGTYKFASNVDASSALAISGGTFNVAVPEEFCATGYIPTELEGGKYGVAKDEYVAKRGDEKFTTLAEAVSLSGSVTLLGDVTENVTIPAGKTVTLDLNGYTISGGTVSGKAAITNNGSLTIVDDSASGSGKVIREDTAPAGSYYVIDNAGTLTITAGTYTNASGDVATHTGASLIRTNKGASTTIAGGIFTQTGFNVLKDEGDSTVTITGGTLACVDAEYAILSYGKLNITGGSITGPIDIRGYKDASEDVTGTATINGGTFNSVFYVEQYTGAPSSGTPSLTITGGTFNNVEIKVGRGKKTANFEADATAGKVAISGGTFSAPVAAAHCAAGLEPAAVTGGYSVAVKHIANTVTVVSAREKTLVTVPQNCKVSELVKLTDGGNALRDVGDKIMAYSTTSKKFYSWMLVDTDPSEAVALGWTPITTASEDDGEGHSTEAENFSLTKGQAVWVTRMDSTKPVFVNGEYNANGEDEASVEARKIAVDTGFNLIAPVPKKVVDENKATVDIAELVQVPEKATPTAAETTDKIVIPTTGAPVTCVVREVEPGVRKWGRWVPYVKANGRGGLRWEEGYEIPTGTGFWYVSENKKDNVSK